MATPVITLLTDFGTADGYVAAMKGVILSICPEARIVDVSHQVRPQAIEEAAFIAATVWPHFPARAIHVAVVDPGVGSDRLGIVVETSGRRYVGPDNGVLAAALPDEARRAASSEGGSAALPLGVRAFALANPAFQRAEVSATFHGRDVFAPAAAHLALGVAPSAFGPALAAIRALPPFRAQREGAGALLGRVLHIDRFGNLITDVRAEDVPPGALTVSVAGRDVRGLARTFSDGGGLLALIGSHGYLMVALRDGAAAAALGAAVGDPVRVTPAPR